MPFIRMLRSEWTLDIGKTFAGDILEVDDERAKRWVAMRLAEPVAEKDLPGFVSPQALSREERDAQVAALQAPSEPDRPSEPAVAEPARHGGRRGGA